MAKTSKPDNIYQKIQKARVELQDLKLKKSGKNQGFTYYELKDFLPAINELCLKHNLFTGFSIVTKKGIESAILTIFNTVEPDQQTDFIIPTAEVKLPGGQEIQGLGAKVTYMRRYVFIVAFEIVESDIVDAIKQQINSELSDRDIKHIAAAKNLSVLTKVCGRLKQTYKASIITPFYNKRKKELEKKK